MHFPKIRTHQPIYFLPLLLFTVATHCKPQSAAVPNLPGAHIDETQATHVISVTPSSPTASDLNPGTPDLPLKTISKAASMAVALNAQGVGSKIMIAPDVYREIIQMPQTGTETSAPIIFQASVEGRAVISGSDVWTGWQPSGIQNVYSHFWPVAWGLAPYPSGWQGNVQLSDIVRRREMIFANGQSLTQVLSLDQVTPGTFFVSEPSQLVYISLPQGLMIGNTLIEVATRHPLFYMQGKNNLILRGLVFEHGNGAVGEGGAVSLNNSSNVLIQNCAIRWNNYEGLSAAVLSNLEVDHTAINFNGGLGFGAWTIASSTVTDSETSYNNWRGLQGGFTDWEASGTKILLAHDVYLLRHQALHNSGRGLWIDTDNVNVSIQSSAFNDNLVDGMLVEATQGPVTVKNSVFSNNGQRGVTLGNATGGDFENNVAYGNAECQFLISGTPGGRWVQDHVTGTVYQAVQSTGWTLNGNIFMGSNPQQLLIGTTLPQNVWQTYISSSHAASNMWFNPAGPTFESAGGGRLDLAGWQLATQLDKTSTFSDPGFADPNHDNFTRHAGMVILSSANIGTIYPGSSMSFQASLFGAKLSQVGWSVSPEIGYMSTDGTYHSPSFVSTPTTVNITAVDLNNSSQIVSTPLTLMPGAPANGILRLYAGAAQYVDPAGSIWTPLGDVFSATQISTSSSIAGTVTAPLYQSAYTNGGLLNYAFFLPDGHYSINLKLAEFQFNQPGKRVFSLNTNGANAVSNWDTVANAGANQAFDLGLNAATANGVVSLQLVPQTGAPAINAIEITPAN